jgi:hypothetical protein
LDRASSLIVAEESQAVGIDIGTTGVKSVLID